MGCHVIQIASFVWLAGIASLGAQPASEFEGRWLDDSMAVTLKSTGAGLELAIELDGEEYGGAATVAQGRLTGSFEAAGERFPFEATIVEQLLHFETDGEVFVLKRAAAAPSRNPLTRRRREEAVLDAESGPRVADFRFQPLEGWDATAADGGSVALVPSDGSAESEEFYALSFLPGVQDPEDPSATAAVHQMLGPSAPVARLESETTQVEGRRIVRRSFVVDASQYRLDGYFAGTDGGLIVVLGRGQSDIVEARGNDLALLASRAVHVGQAGKQSAPDSPPANGIKVSRDAPPFEPGTVSDGQPQSQQWVAHLSGKMVTSALRGAARSSTLLYPDGRVEIAAASTVASGWWRIVTANGVSYLGMVIQPMKEEVYTRLDLRNGQTLADGLRVIVSAP